QVALLEPAAARVVERTVRRAEQTDVLVRFLREDADRFVDLARQRLGARAAQVRMRERVALDEEAAGDLAREQLAALLAVRAEQPLRHDEERRRDLVLLERVDHRRG